MSLFPGIAATAKMSQVSPPAYPRHEAAEQARKLRAAMTETQTDTSKLARRLAARPDVDASVEGVRRNITRWRKRGGISDQNAWILADELGYPNGHFVKNVEDTRSVTEKLVSDVARLERELALLRRRPEPDAQERQTG